MLDFTSTRFLLMFLWDIFFYSLTISSNLSINTFFDIGVEYLEILFFKILMNLLATTDFVSLCVSYISVLFSRSYDLIGLLWNSQPLFNHILFSLRLDSFKNYWKALIIRKTFLQRNSPYISNINISKT